MQETVLTQRTLEEFYSQVILPQFGIRKKYISWQEHLSIGPDNEAHVFLCDDERMVLVFDDYPTTTIESMQVAFPEETFTQISLGDGNAAIASGTPNHADDATLRYAPPVPYIYVHNVTGYYQLFKFDTPIEAVRPMQLKANRHIHQATSAAYTALIEMGFELISLGKNSDNLSQIEHIAQLSQTLATSHGFNDLASWFLDVSVEIDCHEAINGESVATYLAHQKKSLRAFADTARLNPGITGADKDLLEQYTLPIHAKMMQNPEKSPRYFIEMAHVLDRLIRDEELNVTAAAQELSFTLDRPQILADTSLHTAITKAYRLQMPNTLRYKDPMETWQDFYDEIKKREAKP